jgi:hypothetical protein
VKACRVGWLTLAALPLAMAAFTGCESPEGGSANINTSVYYGVGFYDPWYYGAYYPPGVIVAPPPPGNAGPRPEHPIAKPPSVSAPAPRPTPSIPSTPRPMARPAGRR